MLRVHHLNCGTMCPLGGWLLDRASPVLGCAHLVCHCLLIEAPDFLVLVDAGFGTQEVRTRGLRLSPSTRLLARPQLDYKETAKEQVEKLGFAAHDVRHIVVTHLDSDHAGGILDFPDATVHVLAPELEAALASPGSRSQMRYLSEQWNEATRWCPYETHGETWFGFECVRELQGLPPDILLVPLIGHSQGHCGVAVRTKQDWILHAGDSYFFRDEIAPENPRCPLGISIFERLAETNHIARLANQERLRRLCREEGAHVRVFCSHDAVEYQRFRYFESKFTSQAFEENRAS